MIRDFEIKVNCETLVTTCKREAKQGDTVGFKFKIFYGKKPIDMTGYKITLICVINNRKIIIDDSMLEVENNTITLIDNDRKLTNDVGSCNFEITFMKNNQYLTTANIILNVKESLLSASNVLPNITMSALESLRDAIDKGQSILNQFSDLDLDLDILSEIMSNQNLNSLYYEKNEIDRFLNNKVSKIDGKGLSTNDYTDSDKIKVDIIDNTGDGTKYLSDDGTYKTVTSGTSGTSYDDTEIRELIAGKANTQHNHDDRYCKIETLNSTQSLEYTGNNITCENTLTSRISDMLIQGQTYQNLFDVNSIRDNNAEIVGNYIYMKNIRETPLIRYEKPRIKDNTVYTYILDVIENSLSDSSEFRILRPETYGINDYINRNVVFLPEGFTNGRIIKKFTTNSSLASDWNGEISNFFVANNGVTGTIKFSFILLEGDWTNKEVPNTYIDGIESVGEKENKISILSHNNGDLFDDDNTVLPYKQDKKEILLPIEGGLKSLPNGVADAIEQRNDGVYLVQRVKKETYVDGDENNNNYLIDKVNTYKPLETPIETKLDINNLGLEIYEDLTYMTTDNAIQPVLSFKVPNNIGSMVQGNTQNINELYKLIDNGIFSTYDTLYYESKRLFKPKFGGFIDTFPNGERIKTTDEVKARLDLFKDAGIDEWVIQPWIFKDSNFNIVCHYDVEEIKKQVMYAKSIGVTPICLKIHMFEISESDVKDRITLEKFKSQYKKCVIDLAEGLKNLGIKYCVVFNENEWLYGDKTWDPYVLEIINEVKAMGYSTGISTMGIKNTLIMSEDILNAVDAFFGNTYPEISNKLENTSINDAVESINSNQCLRTFKYLKNKYEKEVILSEVGIMDYWACLNDPGRWNWTDELKVPSNGRTEQIVLEGIAKSDINSDLTNHVWWCYDNLVSRGMTREILRNILRGE